MSMPLPNLTRGAYQIEADHSLIRMKKHLNPSIPSIMDQLAASDERLREEMRKLATPQVIERRQILQSTARMNAIAPEQPAQVKTQFSMDDYSFPDEIPAEAESEQLAANLDEEADWNDASWDDAAWKIEQEEKAN